MREVHACGDAGSPGMLEPEGLRRWVEEISRNTRHPWSLVFLHIWLPVEMLTV